MTQTPQFRSRALAVREEARQRLLQVRQSRLAQKQSLQASTAEPEPTKMPESIMDAEVTVVSDQVEGLDNEALDLALPEASDANPAEPILAGGEEAMTEPVAVLEAALAPAFSTEPSQPTRQREAARKTPRVASASTKAKPTRPKPVVQPPSARGPTPRTETPEDRSVLRAALAEMEAIVPPTGDEARLAPIDPEPHAVAELVQPEAAEMIDMLAEAQPDTVASMDAEPEVWAEASQDAVPETLLAEPERPEPEPECWVQADPEPAISTEQPPPLDPIDPVEMPAPTAETAPEAPPPESDVSPEPGIDATAPSDLLLLPGAAPGLVWLLQEMGVRNLSDLAKMEPDALAAGLGIVGRILDVSIWTRFARTHLAPEGMAQDGAE